MALPLNYSVRNIVVRRASALFTALGIAMTVAVFAGVISLQKGFKQLYEDRGRDDVAIYLRPGANSEGESAISRERANILLKERPEIAVDEDGRPLAAAETYLAVYMEQVIGGQTNVPLRGIQPATLELQGDALRLHEGRWLEFGTDEVVVGLPVSGRMVDCALGDTLTLNMTPFKVVGVFEHDGAEGGEIWGDAERFMEALDRTLFQRVVARLVPGTDIAAVSEQLEDDARVPAKVLSEQEYLLNQTDALGGMLEFLAMILTVIMGVAATLGAMNTMLASVGARTHEIGVLLAVGFKRWAIFLAFLAEAAFIGLIGGALGILLVLPFHGMETGLMNWSTFTDVSFAFTLTPDLVVTSVGIAFVLGIIGGALPAIRAAMLKPVEAFRSA